LPFLMIVGGEPGDPARECFPPVRAIGEIIFPVP
jgi:hypothetical protein